MKVNEVFGILVIALLALSVLPIASSQAAVLSNLERKPEITLITPPKNYPSLKTSEPNLLSPILNSLTAESNSPESKIEPLLLNEEIAGDNIRFVTDANGNKRIFILFRGTDNELKTVLNTEGISVRWIAPLAGGNILISAILEDESALYSLARIDAVKKIAADFYIYDIEKYFDDSSITTLKYGKDTGLLMKVEDPLPSDIQDFEPLAYKAVEIEGAPQAWQAGYTGKGVVIAIVDTGVDYGVPNLNTTYIVTNEYVQAFVPDGDSVVITSYVMKPYEINGKYYLPTAGKTFIIFDGFGGYYMQITFDYDFNVTDIVLNNPGLNMNFHFGVFLEWLPTPSYYIVGFPVPVLVIDRDNDNVYDSVYIDVTGVLYSYATSPYAGALLGLPVNDSWMDYKFEGPYYLDPAHPEKALVALDVYYYNYTYVDNTWQLNLTLGKDGYADFSLGVIGVPFLDTMGVVRDALTFYGVSENYELFMSGIDPNGNWVGFMYDFYGHGTSCASTAAGRRVPFLFVFQNDTILQDKTIPRWLNISGVAPEANVMGVRALSWGYVIEGWLFSAGFDASYDPITGVVTWVYTGKHKAHVISNSWGISWMWAEYLGYMFAFDIISVVETSLSLPGEYWGVTGGSEMLVFMMTNITNYEPSVFTHAEGNGGPGYGTANTGPWSPLAIQVAASTTFHWRPVYSEEGEGTYDQMVWWSGRGPVVVGLGGPDVAAIGAYAFETVPLSYTGIGCIAWDLFGGTSQATPMTAGAAAIIVQAMLQNYGGFAPALVKSVLILTAKDLGYDVFAQGGGRIDVYKALQYALNTTTGDIGYFSDTIFEIAAKTIYYSGTYDLMDVGIAYLFGGYRLPGDIINFTLYAIPEFGDNDTIQSVEAKTLALTGIDMITITLDPAKANYSTASGYYFWFDATKLGLDLSHDHIRIVYNASDWETTELSYLAAWVYEDINGDGNITRDEVGLINRFTGIGPFFSVEIGYPSQFTKPVAIGAYGSFSSVTELKLTVFYYDYVTMDNVKFYNVKGDKDNITVELTVPADALPGTYWGYIFITTSEGTIRIPFLYHVIVSLETDGVPVTYGVTDWSEDNSTYPNYHWIFGYDIEWRAEVGEWRAFYIRVNESAMVTVTVEWSDPGTDAYIHVMDAEYGYVIYEEMPNYLGAGQYSDRDPLGNTTTATFPVAGNRLYVVVIRAPVFDGSVYPVSFSVTFTAEKRVGPVIETLSLSTMGSAYTPIIWEGSVFAPEGIENVTVLFDNGIEIVPSSVSVISPLNWIVSLMFYPDSLPEGFSNMTIVAYDSLGVSSNVTYEIFVDRTSPSIPTVLVNEESVLPVSYGEATELNITVKVTDLSPSSGTFIVYDDRGLVYKEFSWMFDFYTGMFLSLSTGLTGVATFNASTGFWLLEFNMTVNASEIIEGYYFLDIIVDDIVYNEVYVTYLIAVEDIAAPEVLGYTLYDQTYTEISYVGDFVTTLIVDIEVYDVNLTDASFYINDQACTNVTLVFSMYGLYEYEVYINATYLLEGNNVFKVVLVDGYNRTTTYTISITKSTVPTVEIIEPTEGALLNTSSVTVVWSGSDAESGIDHYEVRLDNGSWINVGLDTSYTFSGVADGSHVIYVKAVDGIGAEAIANVTITVDTTLPTAVLSIPAGILNTTFSINISVYDEHFAYAEVYIDGILVLKINAPGNVSIEVDPADYVDGSHTVTLVVKDLAGNRVVRTGTFQTAYYAHHEATRVNAVISELSAIATRNLIISIIVSLIVGIIIGFAITRIPKKGA